MAGQVTKTLASYRYGLTAGLFFVLISCGKAGEGVPSKDGGISGVAKDVTGSIASQFGGQSDMAGWIAVLQEKATSISRVSEIDAAGIFTFNHAFVDRPQTLVLLSPDYLLSGVTSIQGTTSAAIQQYFAIDGLTLPRAVHKGQILSFQNLQGLRALGDLASDQDGDGVPDGAASVALTKSDFRLTKGLNLADVDIDIDGTPNNVDPDIDGDGIPNAFDPDDDNDGVIDALDLDRNGDLVPDATGGGTDQYFKEGAEWVAVQFELVPTADGLSESTLRFSIKLRPGIVPTAVQIRGPASLLNDAKTSVVDASGAASLQAWDRQLVDTGTGEDAAAGDGLFARKIYLDTGKVPRANQVVFFQVIFGTDINRWQMEFPFTFPNVKPEKIEAQYEGNTRTVHLNGSPFGAVQDFSWAATVYNSEGKKIYVSPSVKGSVRNFVLPNNILEAGQKYKYSVVAQVLDGVPGYSPYTIHSATADLVQP